MSTLRPETMSLPEHRNSRVQATTFLLIAGGMMRLRSPIGNDNGKSTVASNCTNRKYHPGSDPKPRQAPPAYEDRVCYFSSSKVIDELHPRVGAKGNDLLQHTFFKVRAIVGLPSASFHTAPVSSAKPKTSPKNIETKQTFVRRLQIR